MIPQYATLDDFQGSEFTEDDDGNELTVSDNLLKRASRVIHNLMRTSYYVTDPTTNLPIDQNVIDTLRDATCAQAAWFAISANASGWQVGMPPLSMGPLQLGARSRGAGASDVAASEAKYSRVSPEAIQILKDADMLNQAVGYGVLLGFWSAQ